MLLLQKQQQYEKRCPKGRMKGTVKVLVYGFYPWNAGPIEFLYVSKRILDSHFELRIERKRSSSREMGWTMIPRRVLAQVVAIELNSNLVCASSHALVFSRAIPRLFSKRCETINSF